MYISFDFWLILFQFQQAHFNQAVCRVLFWPVPACYAGTLMEHEHLSDMFVNILSTFAVSELEDKIKQLTRRRNDWIGGDRSAE